MISASTGRVRTIFRASGMTTADEALQCAADLGHGQRELPFGGLYPSRTDPVPRPARLRATLISGTVEEGGDFILQHALEDELGSRSTHLGESIQVADTLDQQDLDLFLDPGARCYPVHKLRFLPFGRFVLYLRSLRLFLFPAKP